MDQRKDLKTHKSKSLVSLGSGGAEGSYGGGANGSVLKLKSVSIAI